MKQRILLLTIIGMLAIVSCRKDVPVAQPGHGSSNYFTLEVKQLPGVTNEGKPFSAVVTVINENNQEVIKNRKLALDYYGTYKTGRILLPSGKYRVSAFIIRNNNDLVLFATPHLGSVRASSITKPLYVSVNLPAPNDQNISMEVASVAANDRAEDFGYPAGSFGEAPAEPISGYYRIRVRTSIQIGDVLYDSIPSLLKLTTWDKQNAVTISSKELQPGTNEILLPRLANKYNLLIERWGYAENQVIDPALIDTIGTYEFKGLMAPRKLSGELTYRVVNGTDKAESKSAYFYNFDNTLDAVFHYQKKADGTPYLAYVDHFKYSNGKLESITQTNDQKMETMSTNFIRDIHGEPINLVHTTDAGVTTLGAVNYRTIPGGRDIQVRYQYSHNTNVMNYNMRFGGGNMIESAAASSNYSSEIGTYQYDFNINPYAVIRLEDLLFTHSSKNNRTAQYVQYTGSIPNAVIYSFDYTYDQFGYPTQVIKKYRSPKSNEHLYTTKTIYTYYE